ncbi:MAG: hypothetical protein IKF41_01320 [Alphaproteobacteria bacterium]|nr:hypothetical protein [Alphaproteobacteria bacterium]
MRKILGFGFFASLLVALVGVVDAGAATKNTVVKKQAALQAGTKVRTRLAPTGIYDEACYNQYFGCMDQFCIVDNENGGSCMCSDDAAKYDEQLEAIKNTLVEAERISTEEVEKIQAGANADIIFNGGERIYNEEGNVVKVGEKPKTQVTLSSFSLFDTEEEDVDEWVDIDLSDKVGRSLYNAAHRLCVEQMSESCDKDMMMLTQLYSRQIISDCKGLANSIAQKKQEADSILAKAKAAVRGALKESFEEANKYDRGTCMVEYKKCMRSEDACGANWENCVFTIASENMQNNAAESVAGTKVDTINTYDITASTMEILESKRFICEKVLDNCMAVRNYVWNDFLRESAPTIRLAEQNIESQKRQSCLSDISDCIQKACKDDIVGKGEATMDACLARPDMARSFCKIQIDPCERMEPQIWDYVKSKLAAMRVDVCTQEVKDCITDENRCGKDFMNCIGMDFKYIHDMCPLDKLVVCKQANPDFQMSDLDSMLMGLYLNIDNKALENCENLAEMKMAELCGSTTDCNVFAADEYLGTNSIRSQKDGSIYRVTGMISFGSIKMGNATGSVKDNGKVLLPGEIGVKDYIREVKKNNRSVENADAIISSIEEELNNIEGTINRAISLIESDQQIQYCINGRDLSQINGQKASARNTTTARFPNLLNQYRVIIGMAALRKAQDNYNKKVNEEIAEAARNSSVDLAQYLCQRIADAGSTSSRDNKIIDETPLTPPYAISYDVGSGLSTKDLIANGAGTSVKTSGVGGGETGTSISTLVNASFDREKRNCHICRTITAEACSRKGGSWFRTRDINCKTDVHEPNCEDVKM